MGGDQVATLAPTDTSLRAVTAREGDHAWLLDGTVGRVLDGDTADVVLLVAAVGDGIGLFAVRDGVECRRQTSIDVTRSFATLELAGAPAQLLGTAEPSALAEIEQWSTLAVVADQVGGAQECLNTTVEYLKTRVQYGRVLGSFQALKHQCAELALRVDEARSALAHLVWALDESPSDVAEAAAIASVVGATTYVACADEAVHLHGGIGFTWEHDAHRHVRRALTDRSVFGSVQTAREAVLAARGL
nr:acyl-CoA dehydrogenase family protein [Gordonia humi]